MKEIDFYGFVKLPKELTPQEFHMKLTNFLEQCGCEISGGVVTSPTGWYGDVGKYTTRDGVVYDSAGKGIGIQGASGGPGEAGIFNYPLTTDEATDVDPLMTCGQCGYRGYQRDLDKHVCKATVL